MLCSLCLKQKQQTIELPCSHVICPQCLPKQSFVKNMFRYQCETCFVFHEIPLKTNNTIGKKEKINEFRDFQMRSSSYSSGSSESRFSGEFVYCWSCEEVVAIKEYIKGIHHKHEVSTYGQAIPKIKSALMQQLRLIKQINGHFQQVKQKLQNNGLQSAYNQILNRVNDFFQKQFDLLETKRNEIVQQLKSHCQKINDQAEESINNLKPIFNNLQQIQTKLVNFLDDRLPITEINPLRNIGQTIDSYKQLMNDKTIFILEEMPHFLVNFSLDSHIEQCCKVQFLPKKQAFRKIQRILSEPRNNKSNESFKKVIARSRNVSQLYTQPSQENEIKFQRKVKLVQKLKNKMKYSASICSTTLI